MKLFFGNTSFEIINIKAKEIKKSQTTLIFYDLKLKKILNFTKVYQLLDYLLKPILL